MGIVEFFLLVIVCVVLAWFAVLIAKKFEAPVLVQQVIWGVAILVILVTLATALGLTHYDPQIPRLR
jgi:uncharacterized membrane protein YoaK (UPF0700 family)